MLDLAFYFRPLSFARSIVDYNIDVGHLLVFGDIGEEYGQLIPIHITPINGGKSNAVDLDHMFDVKVRRWHIREFFPWVARAAPY